MKTNIYKLFLTMCILIGSNTLIAQVHKAEIIATGLTCSMCSNAIKKQLKTIKNVDSVATDLNTNTFSVYLKKDQAVAPSLLKEKVEKAGFFVGSLQLEIDASYLNSYSSQFININSGDLKNKKTVTIQILDKGYVTNKTLKKLEKQYAKISSYQTVNENDYHYKIIN